MLRSNVLIQTIDKGELEMAMPTCKGVQFLDVSKLQIMNIRAE
jgi:hypothetical protein